MRFNFSAAIKRIETLSHNEWIKEFKLQKCSDGCYRILIITSEDVWLELRS